jgi:hypothetical protein
MLFIVDQIGVDIPLIVVASQYVLDSKHSTQHRVVHVVVSMHPVATHRMQVFDSVQIILDDLYVRLVPARIHRIRLPIGHDNDFTRRRVKPDNTFEAAAKILTPLVNRNYDGCRGNPRVRHASPGRRLKQQARANFTANRSC